MFENKVLRKIFRAKRHEITGILRKLHNADLMNCVVRLTYRVLVGRLEGKGPLGRARYRWVDNIKVDLKVMGYDVGN